MKKALIPLAMMAAAGAASAQSSVTLFGVIDATVEHASASGPGSSSLTQLTNSGYNASRIGIRGTEDLGHGVSASFWLEGGLNNDDGSAGGAIAGGNQGLTTSSSGLNFNRRSTVSLSGDWGEWRLGRDYTPSYWNLTQFDPFGSNGVGTTMGLAGAAAYGLTPTGTAGVLERASNSIGYLTPAGLGGFYGQGMYYLGENVQNGATTQKDGNGYGLRFGYAQGPLNVAASVGHTTYAQTATTGDFRTVNLGGQWDFGVVRMMAQYGRDTRESITSLDGRQWLIGALVPVGAGEIRASYSSYRVNENTAGLADPEARKLALGYVYNLSKRTALYATVARLSNSNGSAISLGGATFGAGVVNGTSTAYDLGIRHSF
jgi:predicted porin